MSYLSDRAEALEANRQGRLSEAQRERLRAGMEYKHSGLWGRLTRGFDPLVKDAEAGEVEMIEGAITKRQDWIGNPVRMTDVHPQSPTFVIAVANDEAGTQQFLASRDAYDAAPSMGWVRLFYLPRSRHVVNLELLDRPPREEVSRDGMHKVLSDFRDARHEHDRVGMAEAGAELASMAHVVETYRGEGPAPSSGPSDQRPLSEAIVGTWSSPFLSVTFHDDGTLVFHVAEQAPQEGRWSVGSDGRLHAEMMGAEQSAEASIADDWLTVGLDGQWLRLQRSAPS
jgi:hypothetical protein